MEEKTAGPCVLIRRLDCDMNSIKSALILLLFTVQLIICAGTSVMSTGSLTSSSGGGGLDLQRFSRSHFAFSLDLYSVLADQKPIHSDGEADGNLLFSPYTISTALSMIFLGAGAGSNTSMQLRSALQLNNFSFSAVHDSYKAVLNKLADPYYGEILATVNNIYQHDDKFVSEKYKRALEEFYHVQIQRMDHMRRHLANDDNSNPPNRNDTKRQLSFHLQKSAADQLPSAHQSGLTMVNGLAFRSDWLFRFDPASTFDKGLFYTTSKKRLSQSNGLMIFLLFK